MLYSKMMNDKIQKIIDAEKDPEMKKLLVEIAKDLMKEKEKALKYGLDISKLWKEMLAGMKNN